MHNVIKKDSNKILTVHTKESVYKLERKSKNMSFLQVTCYVLSRILLYNNFTLKNVPGQSTSPDDGHKTTD